MKGLMLAALIVLIIFVIIAIVVGSHLGFFPISSR